MTTGARSPIRFASFGPSIPEIVKREKRPMLDIGAIDAEKYGVKDGEVAYIETVFGRQKFYVHICEIAKGCIHVPFGSGGVNMLGDWKNSNINETCSMKYHDELSGFLVYKSMPCKVYPADC